MGRVWGFGFRVPSQDDTVEVIAVVRISEPLRVALPKPKTLNLSPEPLTQAVRDSGFRVRAKVATSGTLLADFLMIHWRLPRIGWCFGPWLASAWGHFPLPSAVLRQPFLPLLFNRLILWEQVSRLLGPWD